MNGTQPTERLGPKKTFILAIGAAAGVLVTNELIHWWRQQENNGSS
jgi:LPS O-antigen subunit length determinant protein (WzzB/FepE family)